MTFTTQIGSGRAQFTLSNGSFFDALTQRLSPSTIATKEQAR